MNAVDVSKIEHIATLQGMVMMQQMEIAELREALERLLASDNGPISHATERALCEAANDADAPQIVREQAAAVLQARAALGQARSLT